ncbi:hypothetical protein M9H77_09002 [Catharanthus roseus]|uniref:Uncharacterized protein n=1 Tax=Catharanthus roseus TaxID=4058 RepID=A0ACC0BZA8_CATRO|nr:hypothetical protein M9H77_09002 [Catharanthus roseus]
MVLENDDEGSRGTNCLNDILGFEGLNLEEEHEQAAIGNNSQTGEESEADDGEKGYRVKFPIFRPEIDGENPRFMYRLIFERKRLTDAIIEHKVKLGKKIGTLKLDPVRVTSKCKGEIVHGNYTQKRL